MLEREVEQVERLTFATGVVVDPGAGVDERAGDVVLTSQRVAFPQALGVDLRPGELDAEPLELQRDVEPREDVRLGHRPVDGGCGNVVDRIGCEQHVGASNQKGMFSSSFGSLLQFVAPIPALTGCFSDRLPPANFGARSERSVERATAHAAHEGQSFSSGAPSQLMESSTCSGLTRSSSTGSYRETFTTLMYFLSSLSSMSSHAALPSHSHDSELPPSGMSTPCAARVLRSFEFSPRTVAPKLAVTVWTKFLESIDGPLRL